MWRRAAIGAILALAASIAQAHTSAVGYGTLRVQGTRAALRVTIPASQLARFDDDGDSRISAREIDAHRPAIESWIDDRVSLTSDDGSLMRVTLSDVLVPISDAEGGARKNGSATITLFRQFEAARAPRSVVLRGAVMERGETLWIDAVCQGRRAATIGLTENNASATFAAAEVSPATPPQFHPTQWLLLGIEHVLSGWDHLLFLAALLVGASGWRSLAGRVSAFTIGHSITLALASRGIVVLPSRLTETAIAASIAITAIVSLRGANSSKVDRRTLLAGGFGLIHGLGFAAAIPSATASLVPILAAFNIGVELGQLAFVTLVLVPIFRLARLESSSRRLRYVCVVLVAVGTVAAIMRFAA
jgi:hypothetical protein